MRSSHPYKIHSFVAPSNAMLLFGPGRGEDLITVGWFSVFGEGRRRQIAKGSHCAQNSIRVFFRRHQQHLPIAPLAFPPPAQQSSDKDTTQSDKSGDNRRNSSVHERIIAADFTVQPLLAVLGNQIVVVQPASRSRAKGGVDTQASSSTGTGKHQQDTIVPSGRGRFLSHRGSAAAPMGAPLRGECLNVSRAACFRLVLHSASVRRHLVRLGAQSREFPGLSP